MLTEDEVKECAYQAVWIAQSAIQTGGIRNGREIYVRGSIDGAFTAAVFERLCQVKEAEKRGG